MPRGHIDWVDRCGLIVGWAYDETRPFDAILVSVVDAENFEIAAGLAHHYRQDLAKEGFARGWCHFRLRTHKPIDAIRGQPLRLIDKTTNEVLNGPRVVTYLETPEPFFDNVEQLIAGDPTVLQSSDQIEACEADLQAFAASRGVEAFVRTVHVYVLGRVDHKGLALHKQLVSEGRLSPSAMIRLLADSAEFRTSGRRLAAPNSSDFPFRLGN
jgi:hypothetical protein